MNKTVLSICDVSRLDDEVSKDGGSEVVPAITEVAASESVVVTWLLVLVGLFVIDIGPLKMSSLVAITSFEAVELLEMLKDADVVGTL